MMQRIGNIEYDKWRRIDWARHYFALVNSKGKEAAQQIVWEQWYNDKNTFRNLLPNKMALLYNLVTVTKPAYMGTNEMFIQWDSTPVYADDNAYWNGTSPWNCADWKLWHQRLKTKYGRTQANQVWQHAWKDPRNQTIETSWMAWYQSLAGSYGGVLVNTNMNLAALCPADCQFIEYFHSQGMDVNTVFGQTGCNLQNIIVETGNTLSNVASMFSNITTVLKWGVPAALIIYGGYTIRKMTKKNG